MLNEPLAKFYGIDGVTGDALRPVKLAADSQRGGVLTQSYKTGSGSLTRLNISLQNNATFRLGEKE
jgi:hypothetical protein